MEVQATREYYAGEKKIGSCQGVYLEGCRADTQAVGGLLEAHPKLALQVLQP
jgi:hypothetical protein